MKSVIFPSLFSPVELKCKKSNKKRDLLSTFFTTSCNFLQYLLQVSTDFREGHPVHRCWPAGILEGLCWSKYAVPASFYIISMFYLLSTFGWKTGYLTIVFLQQWSMKMSVLSSRDSCSLISAHICPTCLMPQLKLSITSLWKRFSRGSSPLRNR